ncbi:C45 family autoproteolytic acyltransferase/hydolase [Indiicoccus explosivorum]|uniref:C45 family autoproteolytic acyltransferase/hydolase n=1 Tax=Indiicoccus explosivorum TaxID=1917864 RepID=UPI000B451CC0|nr:C45 family peptidase [Indiicoccus explosivorum]
MMRVYSDVVQFRGTHYDFGYKQGELLRDSFILPNRKKQWNAQRARHFMTDEQEALKFLTHFAPNLLEEIQGLSDALGWEPADALREFGGYYIEYTRSGCSILTGDDFMVRNYDSTPLGYEGRFAFYAPTDGGYATAGPSMQITGRTDGINEKGLAMGYNFINRRNSGDGFICNMIGRLVLENCADVDEAIALLRAIPHRRSFSYVLLDPSGETVVVEASAGAVKIRRASISTNHFELLTGENRYRTDDSRRRQKILQEQQESADTAFEAFRLLNSEENEVFSKKYDASAGTLHTAVYMPHSLRIGFALGGNRLPLMMDFGQWLAGKPFNIKRINGEIDSKLPFVNTESI